MRIAVPATGETFDAELVEDAQGVLRVVEGRSVARHALTVILRAGWRIVDATPMEWALLEAHGCSRDSEGATTVRDGEQPADSDRQQCPPCGSSTVLPVSLEDGRVWFVCFKCVHRWSIADRRSPSAAPYGGRERRTRA
jgi:hypothetical protein